MAKLGFSLLVIMQNEWPKAATDVHRFRELSAAYGHTPKPPIILTNVSVAESRAEAQEIALEYLGRKWDSIDDHYHFSDGHLASVKGYESYEKVGVTYAKMKEPARRAKATDFYVSIQVVGTPDDCLQKISELHRLTGMDHLVTEFSFGGLPHHKAELSMRLFADKVLPVLQTDEAFCKPITPAGASDGFEEKHEDVSTRLKTALRHHPPEWRRPYPGPRIVLASGYPGSRPSARHKAGRP